jgi:hypothetical protein
MQGLPGQRITQQNPGTTQPGCGDLERCLEYVATHRFSRAPDGERSDVTDRAGPVVEGSAGHEGRHAACFSLSHFYPLAGSTLGMRQTVTKRFQRQVVAFWVLATADRVFPKMSATGS